MHKKKLVKFLFISEAPASADMNFYKANTVLYKTIKTAFEEQFGLFYNDGSFFKFFESFGCSLDYLCVAPLNKKDASIRLATRRNCIASLVERLKSNQPEVVIIIMKAIEPEIREAIKISGITSIKKIESVPFPAMSEGNRISCIEGIKKLIR